MDNGANNPRTMPQAHAESLGPSLDAPQQPAISLSPWKRLCQNKGALVSLWVLVIITSLGIFGPIFFPEEYTQTSEKQFSPPSLGHPLGTDLNGRDLFYRVLSGARVSLVVGLSGAAISLVIGTVYGMVSGYVGGRVDALMMRVVDVLYAIPRLIFVLILINAFDSSIKDTLSAVLGSDSRVISFSKTIVLVVALGLIEWLTMARIIRGQVLSLKSRQFVTAACALGQSHTRIIFIHLLPNILGIAITYLTLTIPAVILDESFLSFLGLGIEEPLASWGSLLNDGRSVINPVNSFWWLLAFPAIAMSLTLLALNFLGDGLRDLFDPRQK